MNNHLEQIYKEEFIRAKARHDYEKNLKGKENSKQSSKKNFTKYALAFTQILLGFVGIYALYKTYTLFM